MISVADSNTVYYYHADGLGSVIALSDVNNVTVERYTYDVFGEPNRISDVNNPYLFTGRRFDPESGLYYYRARYYAYDIGRFLQTDPIGYADGINWYAYVGNNPVGYMDPLGLCKIIQDLENSRDQSNASNVSELTKELTRLQFLIMQIAMKDPLVSNAAKRAWESSNPMQNGKQLENGFWVLWDQASGTYSIHWFPQDKRKRTSIVPGPTPQIQGETTLFHLHTHPNWPTDRYRQGPSSDDIDFARNRGIPGIIRSHYGDYYYNEYSQQIR